MEKQKGTIHFIRTVLNVTWYLGILATAFLMVFLFVIGMGKDTPPGEKVEITYRSFSSTFLEISMKTMNSENEEIILSPGGMTFQADKKFLARTRMILVPMILLFLAIIFLLRGLFNDLHAGKSPFIKQNSQRIRWVGICIIAVPFVQALANFWIGKYIAEHVNLTGVGFRYGLNLPLGVVFLGIIVLVLSEIFRYGYQLQQEQELTV